jgi:hypothetical protein
MTQVDTEVQTVLDRLVHDGPEIGLQVAAYRDGQLVIDAWAGKGIAARCIHILAEGRHYPQMVYRAYTGLSDRERALECLKAFNDWLLDDFCSADPSRLIGTCMIPWEHPMDVLVAELERVLKKGARAIFLPYTMNPPIYAPYWDPM